MDPRSDELSESRQASRRQATAQDREELLKRAKEGESDAAAELFARHRQAIAMLMARRGVPASEIDDLLSQVQSRFLRNLTRISAPTSFLLTTASNVACSYIKREVREREVMTAYAQLRRPPVVSGEARLILRLDLRDALSAGGPKCRHLIREFVLRQVTYTEYAEESGKPRGTLGPAVGRCLRRAKRYLESRGYAAEVGVR